MQWASCHVCNERGHRSESCPELLGGGGGGGGGGHSHEDEEEALNAEQNTAKAVHNPQDIMIESIDTNRAVSSHGCNRIIHLEMERDGIQTTGVHGTRRLNVLRA